MFQKLLVGLMALVLSVLTPMVVLDHTRTASQIQTLTESSYLSYLEVTKLKKKPDFLQIRAATRLLEVPGMGNGSGVMIAPGRMLTAAHVAAIDEQYPLLLDGKRVKVLKIDEPLDLALLEVEADCPCVPLASAMPDRDTLVAVVGFPVYREGVPQFLTEGRIMGKDSTRPRITSAVLAAPGNSGGGLFVFNDDKWELVGIVVELSAIGSMFGVVPVFHVVHSVALNLFESSFHND